jgi:hypothetical protein
MLREKHEAIAKRMLGFSDDSEEVRTATAVTEKMLVEQGGFNLGKQARDGLIREIISQTTKPLRITVEQQIDRYSQLIKGGRGFYRKEVESIDQNEDLNQQQKENSRLKLRQDYIESKMVELVAKMRVVEYLTAVLSDPYALQHDIDSDQEIVFDPGFETGTVYDEQNKTWISNWNPDVHYGKGTGRFLSEPTIEGVRKGLERYFEMRQQVKELITGVDVRNPQAAQIILEKVFGKDAEKSKIKGGDVLVGPISVTIRIYDEDDYNKVSGVPGSGGVHLTGTGINLIKCWVSSGTVAHENGHSLNEILITNVKGAPSNRYDTLAEEAKIRGISDVELEKVFIKLVEDRIESTANQKLKFFVDEVVAYLLDNDKSPESVLSTLTQNKQYKYHQTGFEPDVELSFYLVQVYIRNFTKQNQSQVNNDLHRRLEELFYDFNLQIIKNLEGRYTDKWYREKQEEVVLALQKMKDSGLSLVETRALIAGVEPLKWMQVAESVERDYDVKSTKSPYAFAERKALDRDRINQRSQYQVEHKKYRFLEKALELLGEDLEKAV